jgi:hypothetical protein
MAKTLELNFDALAGPAKITIKNPKDSLTPAEIKAAMDEIVVSDAFMTTNGNLISAKGARMIDRTTQDIELV